MIYVSSFELLEPPKEHYGKLKNYIDGKWVDTESGEYDEIENPATLEPIYEAPRSTYDEVSEAIEVAQDAWWEWRNTPVVDRARTMMRLVEVLEDEFENLSRILTQEMGKTLYDSRGEIRRGIENAEVAAGIPALMRGDSSEDIARGIDEWTDKTPLGVFALINPYNFPFMVPMWFIPYCLATGNTCIVKPSSKVPNTMNYFFQLIDEHLDLPEGVINFVNAHHGAYDAIYDDSRVKGIASVTSTPAAREIYRKAGQTGKRALCQAGALCFSVLTDSGVIDQTARSSLTSYFGCTGQRCLSNQIMLVYEEVADEFKETMVEYARNFKTGYGLDETVQMGPMIDKAAKEKVLGHIESALDDGMNMLLDGRDVEVGDLPDDCFIGPTILDGLEMKMDVAREEIFGPVMLIKEITGLDEAIEIINEHKMGNATTIYTEKGSEARKFKHDVNIGNVGINIGIVAPMAFYPFGGTKQSFFGVLHGQSESIDFFTDRKVVVERWFD